MIDPGTGLTILGSAIGGAKIAEKILGPTSEYIGDQIKEWAIKKITNTANIFKNAEKKLGDKLKEDGTVPPKVLKGVLEDGSWCEENLQIEYFGGVLASSRTRISRDDRGAYYLSLISRMSTYQLRAHYLIYHLIKQHFDGQTLTIHQADNWNSMELLISFETFHGALDFSYEETENWSNILSHIIWGLNKEQLIVEFMYGNKAHIKKRFPEAEDGGILLSPTKIGVELFMWAYGYGQMNANDFFKCSTTFSNDQNISIGKAIATKK